MNSRLYDIYKSASKLFIKQGYSKTQISHIAKSVGVSVGTIYNDFTGKKEIMQFIMKCTITPDFIDNELERPIKDDIFQNLNYEIETAFENVLIDFSKNLHFMSKYTFEGFISDSFDLVSKYAVACLFIEKNQYEFKKLAEYYKSFRVRFFNIMIKYIEYFIEIQVIREPRYINYTVFHIIETLTWWGMDVYYNAFETLDISLEQSKEVVLDNLVPAYKL